jgi:hypothetical protein
MHARARGCQRRMPPCPKTHQLPQVPARDAAVGLGAARGHVVRRGRKHIHAALPRHAPRTASAFSAFSVFSAAAACARHRPCAAVRPPVPQRQPGRGAHREQRLAGRPAHPRKRGIPVPIIQQRHLICADHNKMPRQRAARARKQAQRRGRGAPGRRAGRGRGGQAVRRSSQRRRPMTTARRPVPSRRRDRGAPTARTRRCRCRQQPAWVVMRA